ncbi:hypothetical protein [Clostridium felsineum]|uniref:hypothetical protein n=1 Tax=Clostridium felsineum TaxID=36839 RepID=UPI00098C77E4|nr:hypothetical protein [Clostridium felsineum]
MVRKAIVNPSVEDILSRKASVPPKKKFDKWFESLTVEEIGHFVLIVVVLIKLKIVTSILGSL